MPRGLARATHASHPFAQACLLTVEPGRFPLRVLSTLTVCPGSGLAASGRATHASHSCLFCPPESYVLSVTA